MSSMRLYDYQLDMKQRIDAAFESHQSVMVQMPTGTGKTCLLAFCVCDWLRLHGGCVWIVTHRRELVAQVRHTLQQVLPEVFGAEGGGAAWADHDARIKVYSIQWLCRHYGEMSEQPGLMVIDEAHHALAATYAEVMNACHGAKKLGLTATPCRLNCRGFGQLFEVLLQSWSYNKFIANGRLSLYDYMSVRPDSEEQKVVCGLKKRAADGDFSLREMREKLDVRPSIERLCHTVQQYAHGKKGIVYAIDIDHANHVADYYCAHGIKALAISARTPADERNRAVERFKQGQIDVLVNVDLFGEGFDCPDVEFIQLARPTLSLAKYLQQVGRGMRVYEGKKYCLILDNVGLYRLFGLPSDDRDWQAMFDGRVAGKADVRQARSVLDMGILTSRSKTADVMSTDAKRTEMVVVMTHDGHRYDLNLDYGYKLVRGMDGRQGIVDAQGNEVLPCTYSKIELTAHGLARLHSRRNSDRERPWIDLKNGVRFVRQPKVVRCEWLEFATADGVRLYPRVQTRWLTETDFVTHDALQRGVEDGLRFRQYYISPSAVPQLYRLVDRMDGYALFEAHDGRYYYKKDYSTNLMPMEWSEWKIEKDQWTRRKESFEQKARHFRETCMFAYPVMADVSAGYRLADYREPLDVRIVRNGATGYNALVRDERTGRWRPAGSYTAVGQQAFGVRVVKNWEGKYLLRTQYFERFDAHVDPKFDYAELLDDAYLHVKEHGTEYYVDLESRICFDTKPELVEIGCVKFQRAGDLYLPFDYRLPGITPYRRGEIVGGNGICFVGKHLVVLEGHTAAYEVKHCYADGKRFVVSRVGHNDTIDLYYDGKGEPELLNRVDAGKVLHQ